MRPIPSFVRSVRTGSTALTGGTALRAVTVALQRIRRFAPSVAPRIVITHREATMHHKHDPASVLPLVLFLAALAIMIYKLLNGDL